MAFDLANMDLENMTEEEQLQAAMQLSMQPAGAGANAAPAKPAAPALDAGSERRPRSFPRKDAQDVLPQLPRGGSKKQRSETPAAGTTGVEVKFSDAEALDLLGLVFGDRPEAADVERWLNVGFQFSEVAGTEWGLWQKHGGPCGVFAPVEAFILKNLLFGSAGNEVGEVENFRKERPLSKADGEDTRPSVLAYALASILFHASPTSSYVVCQVEAQLPGGSAAAPGSAPDAATTAAIAAAAIVTRTGGMSVRGHRYRRIADAFQGLEQAVDSWLAGPCGVLSFVCSVLLTRTSDTLREDMDDPSTPLIGRFGHCAQELVNLMLIGEATSNVFDGSRWLGDDPSSGFLVKGIDGDKVGVPTIGFLSEMEPMRYLQVGSLYKHPEYPIWVLGSPTHYTVVFCTNKSESQVSKEAQFEQKAKKIFNANALDEGSIAMGSSLKPMVDALGLSASHLQQAESQLVNEDIVLWEDFRAWACRQFGLSSDRAAGQVSGKRIKLFLYDGQDPPGPSLRSVDLELSDIDPSLAGGEADTFSATLQTRWPNAIVQVSALAGAGAQGAAGSRHVSV